MNEPSFYLLSALFTLILCGVSLMTAILLHLGMVWLNKKGIVRYSFIKRDSRSIYYCDRCRLLHKVIFISGESHLCEGCEKIVESEDAKEK